jgi:sugar phosphate isomerase/epimerase
MSTNLKLKQYRQVIMKFSVRVSFPESGKYDWFEAVKTFQNIGFVEVAFLDPELFLKADIKEILKPFKKINIKASSIHFAQFKLSNLDLFSNVFNKTTEIAKSLDCDLIVIHPSMGKYEAIKKLLKERIEPVLKKEELYLCWETFESRRRIFGSIEGMFDFCKNTRAHRICYDFSHVHKEQKDILRDLRENINNIKIFHISNRVKNSIKQHYPIYYPEEEMALDFDKILSFLAQIKYSGHLVLEYLPQFHPQLLPDGLKLKNVYEEK